MRERQKEVLERISVHKDKFYKIGIEGYHPLYPSVRDEWVLQPFDMEEFAND